MKLFYDTDTSRTRAFLLEEDGTTVCEVLPPIYSSKAEAVASDLVRGYNAADELLEALKNLMAHPHIAAYLPYAPHDKVMRSAFEAIARAEGADHD